MKIFITGGTGFIGKSLVEYYAAAGHKISTPLRGHNLVLWLNHAIPDLIINSAGEIYNPSSMVESNIGITHTILEWLRNNPTTKLVQIGSSSEYGRLPGPSAETDKINPTNVYDATKGAATLLCQGYARQFNLRTVIARPYSVYGAHEPARRLFPHLYEAFFHNKPMELHAGTHDFIYIDDFIRGIDIVATADTSPGEIVNFGSGATTNNFQVQLLWEKVTGKTAPIKHVARYLRPQDTDFWCCDTTYARDKYGFSTEYSLEQGIEKFISEKLKNET